MAWCVGSVFPTPQLTTASSAVAPVSSLVLDSPKRLLDTGSGFPNAAQRPSDTHYQVECFLDDYKEAFFPEELLIENLQKDTILHSISPFSVGNRLEGVKNREGGLQLFFPVGENTDRIGSCTVFPEPNAVCSGGKLRFATGNNLEYASSSSVRQPILQLGANKMGLPWESELSNVLLAARTPYQVHWLTSQTENNNISVTWRGVENFSHGTSHVIWNPHFPGEAAVVLEDGDVSIFDLDSPGSPVTTLMFKVEEYTGSEDFNLVNHGPSHKRKRSKRTVQSSGVNNTEASKTWWMCEYAWHPKNLLVGGQKEIYLIDMRQKHGSKQFQSSMARINCSSGLFSYCNLMHTTELFTALTRADYDNMFQFAAATTNHLSLYDVRRPNTPLLQWEHRMQDKPPRLLQMYCLSDVCPKFHELPHKHSVGGRVILGCSYESGEIRAFFYGPKPSACPSISEGFKLDWNMSTVSTLDKLYAWDFPKALKSWKAYHHKNLEHAFEAHENSLQTFFKKNYAVEQLTGLLSFSPKSGPSSFTLLQLTGLGLLISQSLKLSEESTSSNHELIGGVSEKRNIFRTKSGKCKTKQYRMEYFPAFFKYLKYGNVNKLYSSKSVYQKSTIEIQDNSLKKETEEGHESSLVNEVPDIVIRKQTACSLCRLARPQRTESTSNYDNQNSEDFLRKMDMQLSPVNLSFTDRASGMTLQSEELLGLSGLKDLFEQWQHSFQPYIDYCFSDVNNNYICESCQISL